MSKKRSHSDTTSTPFCAPAPKIARSLFALVLFIFTSATLFAQEVLKSDREEYFNFLVLEGVAERGFLNYRTLSDSIYAMGDEGTSHPWQAYLGDSSIALTDSTSLRIYGPSVYSSYNSASPYGQNDGVLWQGKGFNAYASAGLRLETYGVELTFKPDVAFSQNLAFDFMTPAYPNDSAPFAGKAGTYGYYGVASIDAPQRFGDAAFFDWSWGDSEVRYTWNGVTIGFGTQNIWLGPARLNPILHSNNAAPYPKLDVGLRRTSVYMPHFGWYLGDVEGRTWWGKTTESEWFDNDTLNDHNLFTGLSLSYAPGFAPNLSFGLHRIMLSKWSDYDWEGMFTLLYPFMETSAGTDVRDQRASLSAQYIFPEVGLDIYVEWGRNDFSPSLDMIIRYPFHTQGYTLGGVKTFSLPWYGLKGEVCVEITNLESSRDYELLWNTTFYAHLQITQGHTNRGQWLGAGMGTGGNSQYLGAKLYYNRGFVQVFTQRQNTDNDYVWFLHQWGTAAEKRKDEHKIKAILSGGIEGLYFINKNFNIKANCVVSEIHNPLYEPLENRAFSQKLKNVHSSISFNYSF